MNTQKSKLVEFEMNNEVPIDKRRELLGEELMTWNIKALPHTTFEMDIGMAIGGMIPLSLMLYGYFGEQGDSFLQGLGTFGVCVVFFFWKMVVRQKNVYQYRITDQGGEVRYWADYPKGFATFFKWLSGIFLFVVICMIAVEPSFIWLLAGPGGMAIAGARFFFAWENKITHHVSCNWGKYNYVTVDRKRRMIIAHQTNLTVGFEVHLSKSLFNVYLETLRSVLPPTAIFTEASWKW